MWWVLLPSANWWLLGLAPAVLGVGLQQSCGCGMGSNQDECNDYFLECKHPCSLMALFMLMEIRKHTLLF